MPPNTSRQPTPAASPADAKAPVKRRVHKDDVVFEASRLFAEKGYGGLTMGELATRLGLRKASLFHHFATKDALYERVLGSLVETFQAVVLEAIASPAPPLDRLDVLTDALIAALGQHPYAARLLVGEAVHGGPLMSNILGRRIDDVLGAARDFVRAGQREGCFDRQLDPTHVVLTVVGALFLPFAIEATVERFAGTAPAHPAFVGARTVAIREQLRQMLGVGSP